MPLQPADAPPPLRVWIHDRLGFTPMFWLAVIGSSILTMLLLASRLILSGQAGHISLVWDVFLAWLPVAPALLIHHFTRQARPNQVLLVILGMGWLLFFPNAPYLVTQLIHLHESHAPSTRPIPNWLREMFPARGPRTPPAWAEFLLLLSVATNGLLLTLTSFQLVEGAIRRRAGKAAALTASAWIAVLTAFGVALGRFARLNSWDVFTRPVETATTILEWFIEPKIGVSTAVLAALLALVYVAIT